jgi:hypothetical protein
LRPRLSLSIRRPSGGQVEDHLNVLFE